MKIEIKQTYGNPNALDQTVRSSRYDSIRPGNPIWHCQIGFETCIKQANRYIGNPNAPNLILDQIVSIWLSDRLTVRSGLIHVKSKQTDALATLT